MKKNIRQLYQIVLLCYDDDEDKDERADVNKK